MEKVKAFLEGPNISRNVIVGFQDVIFLCKNHVFMAMKERDDGGTATTYITLKSCVKLYQVSITSI